MKAGTLRFDGTDLALYGSPRFTIRRTPEPAPPAIATHRRVTITVTVELAAHMPATVWARARRLDALLGSRREGVLAIEGENGATVSWLATPGETGLPEAIANGRGRVDMVFSAIEAVAGADHPAAMSVDPLDGNPVFTLHRVGSWSENIRPTRADSRSAVRSEVTSTVTFSARTAYADAGSLLAVRIETMQAEVTRLRALTGKECLVTFLGDSRTMQFENLTATPSEGWEWIEVQAQARQVTLPGTTEAEVQFDTDEETDPTTGEIRHSVTGTVEAQDKATAHAKVDALLAAWRTPARRVLIVKKTDTWLDGQDADVPEWTGLRFEIRLSEGSTESRYKLKIDTREGSDGRRVTYSGTAHASDLVTLLATVEEAAGGKHPVEVRSEISIDYETDDEGTEKLAQASFSREYLTAGTRLRGSVTRGREQGAFGDWTTTLRGTLSTDTAANARAIARSLIPAGVILRTDSEVDTSGLYGAAVDGTDKVEQWATMEFTYGWGADHAHTAIQYTDTSAPDYSRMVEERTISGTCWAVNKTAAQTQVAALLAGLALANPTKSSLTHSHERTGDSPGATDRWLSYQFSYSYDRAISGLVGHDIIEASWSIERTGMVDHEPMTEVPNSTPVKQVPFGYNIGTLVATGTAKARVQSTAIAWGQGKRAAVASQGGTSGAEDPPRERIGASNIPFSGTTVATYQFDFTYSYRYAAGLTGRMPSGGLL